MVPPSTVYFLLIFTEPTTFNLFLMYFFDGVHYSHLASWPKSDIPCFVPGDKHWLRAAYIHRVCGWRASENFFRLTWINVPESDCSVATARDQWLLTCDKLNAVHDIGMALKLLFKSLKALATNSNQRYFKIGARTRNHISNLIVSHGAYWLA
jgi:hypothetical protein